MEFVDRILRCNVCGSDFVFTADEQFFFYTKQFKNDPKRCKPCRAKLSVTKGKPQSETLVQCADCGIQTTVPFKPTRGTPVLCRACFQRNKDKPNVSGLDASPQIAGMN